MKMVDFLIGHYTYRIFPPAIDIIPTLLAVVYSNGKYSGFRRPAREPEILTLARGGGGMAGGNIL